MRAVLLALAASLGAFSWAAVEAQPFEPSRFLSTAVTIMRVEAPSPGGKVRIGTALTVSPGVVVTNCHVTRDAVGLRVVRGGGHWPVVGQFADEAHDLCFLSVPTWPGQPIPFADASTLRLYQQVVAIGFTGGAEVSMAPGEITGLHGHDGGRIIQSTSRFSSGASGGALLDSDGRLLGVLTFRVRGKTDNYFAVPASWVALRLPIAPEQFRPIGTLEGRAFWEAAACCVPYFMRVSELQSRENWPELLRLADEWIAADPADADAWFARGLASARLSQPGGAAAALEHTVTLAPRNAEAWYELGAVSAASGDSEAFGRALDALTALQPVLARKLAQSLPDRSPAPAPSEPCVECSERVR